MSDEEKDQGQVTQEDTQQEAPQAEEKPEVEESSPEEKPAEEQPQASNDDVKRAGTKEVAANSDAMAIEKDKSESETEEKDGEEEAALPSYFVEEDEKHKIEVDILCGKKEGQVLSVSRTGIGLEFDDFDYLTHTVEWFEFTKPSYEDMSTYRQRCGVYRQEAQQVLIDRLQLRNFLLVWHLKDWSLKDNKGNKVELTHEENGALDDDSMKRAYAVHPTIIDVVLTIFEKDILLT